MRGSDASVRVPAPTVPAPTVDFAAFDAGLRAVLGPRLIEPADNELLERYAGFESRLEAGPYLRYRDVLGAGLVGVAATYGVVPSSPEVTAFGGSVVDWPAFPDSAGALARLKSRFRLGVVTNCDDDLFAASNRRLGVEFDWIVTAQQVGSYKPDPRNFETAFAVWVDRRHDRAGFGATPPAAAVPDLTVPDMATLAELAVS